MRRLSILVAALIVVAASALQAGPASATFGGANGRIVFATNQPGEFVIASMTVNGTDVDFLTSPAQNQTGDGNPAWSPGGTLIVFSRYDAEGDGDIWIMSANGSGQKRLTNTPGDDDWAGFSADGARIYFTTDRHGNYEIYSMLLNGTGLKRLTNNPAVDATPASAPYSPRIAFTSNRRGIFEIWTMDNDGANLARETSGDGLGDFDPAWASSGGVIWFARYLDGDSVDIMTVDLYDNDVDPKIYGGLSELPAPAPDPATTPYDTLYTGFEPNFESHDVIAWGDAASDNLTPTDGYIAWQPDWQAIPEFPLVDAYFSKFRQDIIWAYENGITTGCTAERFCPDDSVTREQMASFLVRALGLSGSPPDVFTDDDTSSHEHNINLLAQAGITTGCGPGLYCPKQVVKRDQMASFIARALNLPATPTDYFTDDEGNSHEANINRLREAGITTGCTNSTYCPARNVTRGEMAAFLHRGFD